MSVLAGPLDVGAAHPALLGFVPRPVLESPFVRRLARVSFLGALDFAPGCRQPTSRLDHCAAVAALAVEAGRGLRLEPEELRLFVTAAFLHDVGHWPFSHSAEAAFRAAAGVDHHGLARWMVLGGGPIARADSLGPDLERGGLDPEAVWRLIEGRAPLSPLICGAVNLDTLDGIRRAARAFGLKGSALPALPFELRQGEAWIRPEAVPVIDRFWRLKNRIYRDMINRPDLAALELRFASAVSGVLDAALLADVPSLDDEAILARLGPAAVETATGMPGACRYASAADPRLAPVRVLRRHDVDPRVAPGPGGLAPEAWPRRWTQRRERWFLVVEDAPLQLTLEALLETQGPDL